MMLWHGTRTNNPESIYKGKEVGFDVRVARLTGLQGAGIYFSDDALYSFNDFSYHNIEKKVN